MVGAYVWYASLHVIPTVDSALYPFFYLLAKCPCTATGEKTHAHIPVSMAKDRPQVDVLFFNTASHPFHHLSFSLSSPKICMAKDLSQVDILFFYTASHPFHCLSFSLPSPTISMAKDLPRFDVLFFTTASHPFHRLSFSLPSSTVSAMFETTSVLRYRAKQTLLEMSSMCFST